MTWLFWIGVTVVVLVKFPYRRVYVLWHDRRDEGLDLPVPAPTAPVRVVTKPTRIRYNHGMDAKYDDTKLIEAQKRARTRDLLKRKAEQLHPEPSATVHYPTLVKKTGSE